MIEDLLNRRSVLDQREQQVGNQVNVAGDYHAAPAPSVELEKRDALREILGKTQAMVCVLQTANAKRDEEEWQEKRDRLCSDLGRVIPFFVDDDETSNSLNRLLHLLRLENAHPDRKTISYEFDDYIQTLENKLIAINESLSGR